MGEEEAEAAEQVVRDKRRPRWTIVRASWFAQNFSEGMLLEADARGTIALPAGDVREPFVDVEDIADVAVPPSLEPGHDGRTYDVTGPRLLTFAERRPRLSAASGRPIAYLDVSPTEFVAGAIADGVPIELAGELRPCARPCSTAATSTWATACRKHSAGRPAISATSPSRAAAEGAWSIGRHRGAR